MPEAKNSNERKPKISYMLFGTDLYGVTPNVPFNSGSVQNPGVLEPLLRLFRAKKETLTKPDDTPSKPEK